jgi:phosphoribosylformylglycinamidine cyclo-ligase
MAMQTYKDAGVDIEKGQRIADFIRRIKSKAIPLDLGGFAGVVNLDLRGCHNPVMLTTSDGVGTKLLVARKLERYDTIGIDLVAMCANDIMVCGVAPLSFQDYIACGRISEGTLQSVLKGIVRGCEIAGCKLTGGETAELPDMYAEDEIDLAGFCTGVGDRQRLLPQLQRIREGDVVIGLPSAGIHSNGISLARKVLTESAEWEEMLVPTKIYVSELKILLESGRILAAAHVTGGGLIDNLQRVLPGNLKPQIDFDWPRPWIFERIQERGQISESEMRKTYNLGIGIALVVSSESEREVLSYAENHGISAMRLGRLQSQNE